MMRTRNILLIMVALGAVTLGATSCGTAMNLARSGAATYVDDLYGVHDTEALREAERLLAIEEAEREAEREKRIAAMIAAANAEADIDELLSDVDIVESPAGVVVPSDGGGVSIYNNIYVDDYKSAYARRLQGFSSLTYRMPSSYWDYRYGDAYFLTLAYDPAFYTVMVMGDQVWVEPRYITNMFGSWNNPYYYGYRYGYNPYYFGYSYGYWDYWGWNSPYWGCDPFYHYHCHNHWYGPHYGHPHHPPHPPVAGGHKNPNVTHRPSYGMTAGGGSTSRPSYREQLGGGLRSENRGGTQVAVGTRGEGSTSSRGNVTVGSSARPSISTGRVSGTTSGVRGEITLPTSKNELSGTLTGSTIKPENLRPTRGGGVSGVSNSSSRSSRSTIINRSGSSSSTSHSVGVKSGSSSSRSVGVGSSSRSSSRSSSSVSSSRSSSSRGSFSSGSSSSSSRSSGSTLSSGSSRSSNSSYSSGSSSSSSRSSSSSSRSSRR